MRKNICLIVCAAAVLPFFSCLSLPDGFGAGNRMTVTNEEAVTAMKDALTEGIRAAGDELSAENGYFGNPLLKITLPPEARPIVDAVSSIPGGQKMADDVVLRINRAAEDAAREAVPVFTDAITGMTVSDGIAIVTGGPTAATDYLKEKTIERLTELYRPKVEDALIKPLLLDRSAESSWNALAAAYNKAGEIPNRTAAFLGQPEPMPPVEADLASFVTEKALDGLFEKVAEEEKNIRADPAAYASAMIRKVFGAVKDGFLRA